MCFQILHLYLENFELEHEFPSNTKSEFSATKITNKATVKKSHFEPTGSDFTSGATLVTCGKDANLSNTSLRDVTKVRNIGCVYSNDIVYQGNNNIDGNSSAVEKNVEKSEKFVGLNLDSPFDVYGFITWNFLVKVFFNFIMFVWSAY